MDLSFTGATAEQERLTRAALAGLLLDTGSLPLNVEVEFVADPNPEVHNEFGFAEGSGGSGTISIRSDAPRFLGIDPAGSYGMPFYNELVAHELCHVLLGNMSDSDKGAVAALFETTPETWSAGSEWQNRPLEGICETFKDAFLPQRLRKFANRTNRKLSISKYPQFRSLFRNLSGETTFKFILADAGDELFRNPSYSNRNLYLTPAFIGAGDLLNPGGSTDLFAVCRLPEDDEDGDDFAEEDFDGLVYATDGFSLSVRTTAPTPRDILGPAQPSALISCILHDLDADMRATPFWSYGATPEDDGATDIGGDVGHFNAVAFDDGTVKGFDAVIPASNSVGFEVAVAFDTVSGTSSSEALAAYRSMTEGDTFEFSQVPARGVVDGKRGLSGRRRSNRRIVGG